jgi:hypothetical protein
MVATKDKRPKLAPASRWSRFLNWLYWMFDVLFPQPFLLGPKRQRFKEERNPVVLKKRARPRLTVVKPNRTNATS